MLIGSQLSYHANSNTYTTRNDRINPTPWDGSDVTLGNVDFSDPTAVDNARTAIMQMRAWDDFVDWGFRPECQGVARRTIADMVLQLKAAIWADDFPNETMVDGFKPEDLYAAQVRLFSLLSAQGLEAMTAMPQLVAEGIRYMPHMGSAEGNGLLRMVVTSHVVSALTELGPQASAATNTLSEHAQIWEEAEPYRAEAVRLEGLARSGQTDYDSAIAMEAAARIWETADESRIAVGRALRFAAWHWKQFGTTERAAQLEQAAAEIFEAAGKASESARAYAEAASNWSLLGDQATAAECYAKEAAAWEVSGYYQWAAESYQAAGSPIRAASAWKLALDDADANANALAQWDVITNAAPLFEFDMESEEKLVG